MIRQIAPQFFTLDIPGTLAYYTDKLGFKCLGTWQHPPVYAIVARDQHWMHIYGASRFTDNPDKYSDELLTAYLLIEGVEVPHDAYAHGGVGFAGGLGNTPWQSREF